MSARAIRAIVAFSLLSVPALSAEHGLDALHGLMACIEAPTPTLVVHTLIAQGTLVDRVGPGFDEDYCWSFAVPHQWDGITFTGLCVVTGDTNEQSNHPDLYWNDAIAPWTEVWLITATPPPDLDSWAAVRLPSSSRYEIDPLDRTNSALSCSEWHFPPG